jgi:type I restriction enzyme, R subunit
MPVHTEKTFEEAIEAHLLEHGGWAKGYPNDFNRSLALRPKDLFAFVQDSQPELWSELRKQQPSGLEEAVIDALVKTLESWGTIDVLRHGFKFFGKKIDLAYFKPAHGLNPEIVAKYGKNRLVLTRQVKFIPDRDDSVDMLLSVNGLPVATVELKNPLTGQNIDDAIAQYKRRDPKQPLFQFKKRALVHFGVDPDLVAMTTRLAGKDTGFLPFNRGFNGGRGNPPHPSGYKTAYLWEEVWQRDSFLDILAAFIHLIEEEKKVNGQKVKTETMVFPRYHQLDCVRKLVDAARRTTGGENFLVEHSAGSGKSNSIAWLAHRLSSLHDYKDNRVYDSVVVITDRTVLDKQLQDTIYQFEHKQGVVARIDENSTQLAEELMKGTPIIITTLQKFPFVSEKIGELPNRRYAVIVDEAHSSQTGEAARHMKEILAAKDLQEAEKEDEEGDETWEDRITEVMRSRGRQKNLCFFAFTATPKAKTLEIFGRKGPDGKPAPFHLYSMRQAIEEGFILDVLQNYTTYKRYYKLVKTCEDDPKVNAKHAKSQLARFIEIHPHNLAQKTEVMVEHFRSKVRHRIEGRAKAMVVTGSRLHAVRYKQTFDKYLAEKGYDDVGVLVAFSGTVRDPELASVEYTEPQMNKGIKEKELPDKFDTDDYQLLLVANKYQTGFDQPLLHTMYVDKRLSGVQAVQTLSRLNRTHPGKSDTFILDFVNDPEEIRRSFQPYYEQTVIAESPEPQQLYDLQHKLDAAQVYFQSEVEAFAKVFYKPVAKQTAQDQADLYRHLNPAVERFKALDDDAKDEFRNSLKAFVRLYSFMSQIMPFRDPDLEKLYTFGRFLELKLPHDERKGGLVLDDEVELKYYRLEKLSEASIALKAGEPMGLFGPTEVGTRTAREKEVPLSEIIDILNDRFGTNFKKADQLFFDQVTEEAKADQEVVEQAAANPFDNFALALKSKIEGLMLDRMDQNQDIVTKYLNEPEFQNVTFKELAKRIYDGLRRPAPADKGGEAPKR